MAKRKRAQAAGSKGSPATSDVVEQKVVAFAEQLGTLVGTVQSRAEGWLDRKALTREITRIRDGAADLLGHVQGIRASRRTTKMRAAAPAQSGRGLVDAPGKRHRKPLPSERIDKRMGEPRGKQMGQKSAKRGPRGGR